MMHTQQEQPSSLIACIKFCETRDCCKEQAEECGSIATLAAYRDVQEVVTQLYDTGFKDPLVIVECAIAYLQNPTVPGHPEKQKLTKKGVKK